MKKLLLSAFTFAAIVGSVKAQIFTENFNAGIPGTFTLTNVDGLTPAQNVGQFTDAWIGTNVEDDNGLVKTGVASTSWYNPAGTADDWISTPAITIPTTTNQVVLEWSSLAADAGFPDGLEVYVSTTGATVADFTAAAVYSSTNEPVIWTTQQVNLTSFTGQTIYIGFRNNSTDDFVLALDDIVVRELFPDDARMAALDIVRYGANGNVDIVGTIQNDGSNPITSFDISYVANGAAPVTQTITQTVAPGAFFNFTHSNPLAATAGNSYNIDVTVTIANDGDASDDALSAEHVALTSIPTKINVGEEKTGTWCQFCPRGAVGLATMETESDFIGIAVHNNDPMAISAYDGNLATYIPGGYPGGGIDRVISLDPNASDLLAGHNTRKTTIVPCQVNSITAIFDATNNDISVSTDVEFLGTITGDFRLSCVIIEDDLQATGNSWNQINAYAGGGIGALALPNGGYDFAASSAPSSVPAAAFGGYDHVARSLSNNDILGNVNSLPTGSVPLGTYNYSFADVATNSLAGFTDAGFEYSKAYAVVMIIDVSTGEILNAGKTRILNPLSTADYAAAEYNLNVFPNPTADNANVSFYLNEAETVEMNVYNSVGSLVFTQNVGSMNKGNQTLSFDGSDLESGFYFVNLTIGDQIISKKVSLLK